MTETVPERTHQAGDAEVIRVSLGQPEVFAHLFDRHADAIHDYAARRLGEHPADDVTAETFLVAFRKRNRYDLARDDARPWLYGIAANLIAGHRRQEVRRLKAMARAPHSDERHSDEPFDEQRIVERASAAALRPALAAALARLSAAERDLLLLVAWADLTYEEAARALGVPVGTVRSRLHRVRAKLRRHLPEERS